MRTFLRELKLLPAHFTDLPLLQSFVPADTLQSYMTNGSPLQNVTSPQLAWDKPWSHQWNKGMTFLLSQKFLEEIRSGTRPLLTARTSTPRSNITSLEVYVSSLTPKVVQSLIQNKLHRTRTVYLVQSKASNEDEQADLKIRRSTNQRRSSRRKLVRINIQYSSLLVH